MPPQEGYAGSGQSILWLVTCPELFYAPSLHLEIQSAYTSATRDAGDMRCSNGMICLYFAIKYMGIVRPGHSGPPI